LRPLGAYKNGVSLTKPTQNNVKIPPRAGLVLPTMFIEILWSLGTFLQADPAKRRDYFNQLSLMRSYGAFKERVEITKPTLNESRMGKKIAMKKKIILVSQYYLKYTFFI
tara:strand:+ start:53 stop:382 length:330 start_codon:yes stop_codon:yes gene_type:complete